MIKKKEINKAKSKENTIRYLPYIRVQKYETTNAILLMLPFCYAVFIII